ncbi:MAG: hypothetical protein AAF999_17325 [Pseudomonadota bacterium]
MAVTLAGVGTAVGIADGVKKLFGGSKGPGVKKQLRLQREDAERRAVRMPAKQVRGFERAGINPIFGLSGGASYGSGHAAPAVGDAYASPGGLFAQVLQMDHEKQLQKTALEHENQKLRQTVDKLAKPSEPTYLEQYGAVMPLPSQRSSSENVPQNFRLAGVRADGPEADASRNLNVVTPFGTVQTDPRWTPTEDIETEYGEPAAWLYSGIRAADAIADTLTVPAWRGYRDHVGAPFARWMMAVGDNQGTVKKSTVTDKWGSSLPRSVAPTRSEIDKHTFRRNVSGGISLF